MNDLDLHRRLNDLADDLSAGADPLAQLDSARSAHRRQRRNRIAIAGAAAAIAVLAMGVPIISSTLTALEGRHVAAPTTTEPASPTGSGSAETSGPPAISQLNEDVARVVNTLSTRTPPLDLAAPAEPASCPDATAELSDAVATVLIRQDSDDPNDGCGWTTTALRADRLSLGFAFLRTADDAVLQMIIDENAKAATGQEDAAEHPGTCFSSDLSDTPRQTTVQACSVAGRGTQWTVLSDVGERAGLWQLTVNVPADVDAEVDDAGAVLALVDVVEAAW
jgi:hypothetical protein